MYEGKFDKAFLKGRCIEIKQNSYSKSKQMVHLQN